MHIGFTGTKEGMTDKQKEEVKSILESLGGKYFHHGDCVGADAEAHDIAVKLGMIIAIHPPTNEKHRAFCDAETINDAKDYLDRNKDIVKASEIMLATPREFTEKIRSGTWSTVRFTRKKNKDLYIIYPDGSIKGELNTK